MDEVFSLKLAEKHLPHFWDLARRDLHPPLYYLLLKFWLALPSLLGGEGSILWARLPNILVWGASGWIAWRLQLVRFPDWRAAWGALLMLVSPAFLQLTQDARSYGLASGGIALAYLALIGSRASRDRNQRFQLAVTFIASAAVAVWSHFVSWIAVALLCSVWIHVHTGPAEPPPRRWTRGLVPPLIVTAAALPLFVNVSENVGRLTAGSATWMTEPTFGNLLRTFAVWLPLGRDGGALLAQFPLASGIVAAMALSLALALARIRVFRSSATQRQRQQASDGVLGLAIGFVLALSLWSAARWLGVPVFHGPRYPLLGVGPWVLGAWSLMASSVRSNQRPRWLVLLSSPWLLSGIVALALMAGSSARSPELRSAVLLDDAAPVFYAPEQLDPYFRRTLSSIPARPFFEHFCEGQTRFPFRLLILNRWRELDSPAALLLHTAIANGSLGPVEHAPFPVATRDFEFLTLGGAHLATSRELLCDAFRTISSPSPHWPDGMVANLAAQRLNDGWSYLEFNDRFDQFRWTDSRSAVLRFEGIAESGSYELRLVGGVGVGRTLTLALPEARWRTQVELGGSAFTLAVPLQISSRTANPRFVLSCEQLLAAQVGGPEPFTRQLGFYLRSASLTRASQERPPPS